VKRNGTALLIATILSFASLASAQQGPPAEPGAAPAQPTSAPAAPPAEPPPADAAAAGGAADEGALPAPPDGMTNERLLELAADASVHEAGKAIFQSKCASCHKPEGTGLVGPNLTDDQQVHGTRAIHLYNTIRVGVPAKGMVSWEPLLKKEELQAVTAFVISLRKTNVPGGKPPEGHPIGDVPMVKVAAAAAATTVKLPELADPQLKAHFASIKFEKPRLILEAAAATSLASEDKTYFEWLVEKNDQPYLKDAVALVAGAQSEAAAEGAAEQMARLLEVPVANDSEYGKMHEVAINAMGSVERGVPYVMPPAPPITSVDGSYWTQPEASTIAAEVDWMFYGILWLSVISFVGITIATIWFTLKYRHRKGHKSEPSASHNDALEITWTVIPSILLVFVFILGWKGFNNMMSAPRHALEVQVIAQKWNWTFIYPNGWTDNVLHVPAGKKVRLVMRSEDVLHDFSLPAFRLKQDVIPRRYTKIWFQVDKPGVYRAYCAEYCGQQHSDMKTWVQVHEAGGYEKYLEQAEEQQKKMPQEEIGKLMYAKRGCGQCHSVDGSPGTGPSFKGLFGTSRELADGSSVVADEDYIRESILEPQAKVRKGFNPVMPTFQGKLKDWQIDGIIAYIKSLK